LRDSECFGLALLLDQIAVEKAPKVGACRCRRDSGLLTVASSVGAADEGLLESI
jgi:hypothetical protein